MCICAYVHMYMCAYVHMCICAYVHICIFAFVHNIHFILFEFDILFNVCRVLNGTFVIHTEILISETARSVSESAHPFPARHICFSRGACSFQVGGH